jgi:hypothetical protein
MKISLLISTSTIDWNCYCSFAPSMARAMPINLDQ